MSFHQTDNYRSKFSQCRTNPAWFYNSKTLKNTRNPINSTTHSRVQHFPQNQPEMRSYLNDLSKQIKNLKIQIASIRKKYQLKTHNKRKSNVNEDLSQHIQTAYHKNVNKLEVGESQTEIRYLNKILAHLKKEQEEYELSIKQQQKAIGSLVKIYQKLCNNEPIDTTLEWRTKNQKTNTSDRIH